MIENNLIIFSLIFFCIMIIFHIGSNNNLRPKIIFDIYFTFYLFIASVISLHIFVFIYFDVDVDFMLTFIMSILFFTISFFLSSYFFGTKLGVDIKKIKKNIPILNNLKIYQMSNFIIIFSLFSLFSLFVATDNITKFITLDNLHSDNAAYVLENQSSKLIGYFANFLPLANLYFFTYIFLFKKKTKQKNFLTFVYFIIQASIYFTSVSRSSIVQLFLPLGLISIYLFHSNPLLYRKVIRIQVFFVLIAVSYGIWLTSMDHGGLVNAISTLGYRLFLTSDVALWFHTYAQLNIDMFKEYDLSYFFHPFMKILGIPDNITSGLGPKIAEIAGSTDAGKGPVPTFFYEAYITSKSTLFTILYSIFIGILIPFLRYKAILYFFKLSQNSKYFFLSGAFYFFSTAITGDFLNFETSLIVFSIIALLIYFVVKIKINNIYKELV